MSDICISPACKDRADCVRHWSHYSEADRRGRVFVCRDGSVGKDCGFYTDRGPYKRLAYLNDDGTVYATQQGNKWLRYPPGITLEDLDRIEQQAHRAAPSQPGINET